MFGQMVVAIALLHTHNLVHQSLKPANIFIDENLNIIVGINNKFGCCYYLLFVGDFDKPVNAASTPAKVIHSLKSLLCMAPELIRNEKYENY
jgi:serine/threonine protein kinase